MTVRMDVVDVDSINAAHAAVERGFGRVDVLVNNAGMLIAEHDEVLAIPSEAYRRTFETNVFGVIEVCRLFAPAMARAGYGRIVNVSSGAGQLTAMSTTYAPAYSTSKTTLNAFTRILATRIERRACSSMKSTQAGSERTWVPFRPAITP